MCSVPWFAQCSCRRWSCTALFLESKSTRSSTGRPENPWVKLSAALFTCVVRDSDPDVFQGYTPHIISTISEWSLALSFISFFLTYIRDFKVRDLTSDVINLLNASQMCLSLRRRSICVPRRKFRATTSTSRIITGPFLLAGRQRRRRCSLGASDHGTKGLWRSSRGQRHSGLKAETQDRPCRSAETSY